MMTAKSGSVSLFLVAWCSFLAEIKIKAQDIGWTGEKIKKQTTEFSSTLPSALHGFQMGIILAHTHTPDQGIL